MIMYRDTHEHELSISIAPSGASLGLGGGWPILLCLSISHHWLVGQSVYGPCALPLSPFLLCSGSGSGVSVPAVSAV